MNRGGKYYIETYGCQMNDYDSRIVESMLRSEGFSPAEDKEQADLLLLNSCCVRRHAEERVFSLIAQYKRLKADRPSMKLGLIGCTARKYGSTLLEKFPQLDIVAGPDDYRAMMETLRGDDGERAAFCGGGSRESYDDVMPFQEGPCAGVAVMRGCDNFCSYCVVPYVRGRERSRPLRSLLNEFDMLARTGVREITLLGQNVNSYRDGGYDFTVLLRATGKVEGIERVRFMTSHPKDLSPALLEAVAECEEAAPHLHLPVQAGSDRILARMNRSYTVEKYLQLVKTAREIVPDISLTTDIIVGFPGETGDDYRKTLDLVEQVRFDDAFTYRYSVREGTKAAKMVDDVPEEVKLERLANLISMVRRIGLENLNRLKGCSFTLLVERESKKDEDWWMGRTEHNRVAVIPKGDSRVGDLVKFSAEDISGFTLRAAAEVGCLVG